MEWAEAEASFRTWGGSAGPAGFGWGGDLGEVIGWGGKGEGVGEFNGVYI